MRIFPVDRNMGAFPIGRGGAGRHTGGAGNDARTRPVLVAPVVTRHRGGALGKADRSAGEISRDARTAVIPVAKVGLNQSRAPGVDQRGRVIFGCPSSPQDLLAPVGTGAAHVLITEGLMTAIAGILAEAGVGTPVGAPAGNPRSPVEQRHTC